MARWERRVLKLKENHGWECKPGYKIFVADRGAVRFDIPDSWVIVPGEKGSIRFHDRQPPDDDCTLEMSVFYLNDDIDWSGLRLSLLIKDLVAKDTRDVFHRGDPVDIRRGKLEVCWGELRFNDPNEQREARSRIALARWSNIQPLITFDFWEADAPRLIKVWHEVMSTLVLGDYIEDPTQRVLD